MDQIDSQILELLAQNARMSLKDIGMAVNLSSPAVKERIVRMEERGVIEGYTVKVNRKQLGQPVEAFIMFETTDCAAFRKFAWAQPEVVECHRLAGKYSYLVKIDTESMATLEQFIDAALEYGSSSTHMVFSSRYRVLGE